MVLGGSVGTLTGPWPKCEVVDRDGEECEAGSRGGCEGGYGIGISHRFQLKIFNPEVVHRS